MRRRRGSTSSQERDYAASYDIAIAPKRVERAQEPDQAAQVEEAEEPEQVKPTGRGAPPEQVHQPEQDDVPQVERAPLPEHDQAPRLAAQPEEVAPLRQVLVHDQGLESRVEHQPQPEHAAGLERDSSPQLEQVVPQPDHVLQSPRERLPASGHDEAHRSEHAPNQVHNLHHEEASQPAEQGEAMPESKSEAKREARREARREAKREAQAKREVELEAKREAHAKREVEREAKREAKAEHDAPAEGEAKAEHDAPAEREATLEAKREARREAQTRRRSEREAKREAKRAAKAERQAEGQAERAAKGEVEAKATSEAGTEREAEEETAARAQPGAKAERGAKTEFEATAAPSPEKETKRSPEPGAPPRLPRRGVAWALLSLFVVAGLGCAALAGWQWGRSVDRQARQSFDRQASGVATAVTKALQRDADLTATTAAIVGQDPQMTDAGLAQWLSALTTPHVPGTLGITYVQQVESSDLYYFWVPIASDPASTLHAGAPATIVPTGASAPYCLTRLMAFDSAVKNAADAAVPPGLDWCATPAAAALATARDTGQLTVAKVLMPDEATVLGLKPSASTPGGAQVESLKSIDAALGEAVVIYAPLYQGSRPNTVTGRRTAFEGWVGDVFDTGPILAGAVGAGSDLHVTLTRQNPGAAAMVISSHDTTGTSSGLVDTIGTRADGRWTITVSGPSTGGWAAGRAQGLAVGGVVALGTLLLFLVLRSLVASRRRAWELSSVQSGELHHLALYDVLTGLPNRSLLVDRAEQMLSRSRRSQLPTAALILGVDDFKAFNTDHGRRTGDELLQAMAERLVVVLREADTVGRLGADEFLVLTDGATLTAGPELVAERILEVLHEPFYLGEDHRNPYDVSASVGIALGPRIDAEDLLRDANSALSEAKQAGKGRFSVFGQDMPQAVEGRKQFENELRTAVAANQFFLRYQPIFDIDTRMTTGVEALLRWQHPTRRVIPPDHFLPLLEESGLIVPLGRWVLQESCRQGAALHASGYRIAMSVNVSARQLESDTLVADVRDALNASDFDPHALVIEVTETTLMRDTALMIDRLIALKSLGVRIAIDDFGTGYSSLAYLRQFPLDILKIDRSFISSMISTRDSSMIIHTLVQFGKTLGLETIAEGIEEEGQLDPLLAEQCDTGQGFLYGRPLSPTQLDIFLRTHLTQEPPLWVVPPMQGVN